VSKTVNLEKAREVRAAKTDPTYLDSRANWNSAKSTGGRLARVEKKEKGGRESERKIWGAFAQRKRNKKQPQQDDGGGEGKQIAEFRTKKGNESRRDVQVYRTPSHVGRTH